MQLTNSKYMFLTFTLIKLRDGISPKTNWEIKNSDLSLFKQDHYTAMKEMYAKCTITYETSFIPALNGWWLYVRISQWDEEHQGDKKEQLPRYLN